MLVNIAARWLTSWQKKHRLSREDSPFFSSAGKKFLHVGCSRARQKDVSPGLRGGDWQEIRLDIDPNAAPDIVADMLDMAPVPSQAVEALYSSHNIEHLYPHEVPRALGEFYRVLKDDGFAVITCPDLQSLGERLAAGEIEQPLYVSPAGPIAPLDVLYGHRPALQAGNLFMAHRCGFTLNSLLALLRAAGFASVAGYRQSAAFALWVVAAKNKLSDKELRALAAVHLPQ